MRPPSLFFIAGRQAFTEMKVPLRLVPITSSQSSPVIASSLTCGKMPALAQRMSRPPWRSTAAAAAASIASRSRTSAAKAEASPPASRSSFAVASAASMWRATTSTRAP